MKKRRQALQNQVRRLQRQQMQQQRLSDRLAQARLILFVLAALVSGFTFLNWGAVPWLVVTLVAFLPFVGMVIAHQRLDTAVTRTTIYLQLKQTHLARLALDWANLPAPLASPDRLEHPFAHDLDLLGPRSLHHLLDTAVSHEGSTQLRDWLLHTNPDADTIAHRQTLVGELARLPRFRDRLALQATLVAQSGRFSGRRLVDWLNEAHDPAVLRPLLILLSLLAAVNIVLFLLAMANIIPNIWLLTWVAYAALYVIFGMRRIGTLFGDVLTLQDGLETVQAVFGFLESQRYGRTPHLQALCTPFLDVAERPSQYIRRTRRVAAGVGVQQNPFVGLFLNAVLPWNLFFAYQMARCQLALQERLPVWLNVWYELEAFNSLANFAWLNPDTTSFPQILDEYKKPDFGNQRLLEKSGFSVTQLGHPLVTAEQRVCNDFQSYEAGSVTIITGSNMAGKSTFLRALGVNLVLAYTGGPVLAAELHTSLFRLFASIRVADSLTDGFSFFYAEVRRLEQLLVASQAEDARPLFFLIDEIFRGTNNRERLLGSRAYIRALAEGKGMGVIATHDLELIHLADENGRIRNFHFRDDVLDGRMTFDYKLHPGPCPTTNALKIMRLAGLPIGEESEQ